MGNNKRNISTSPYSLASHVRGFYSRVARQLDVDPSYVSRVARGERQSEAIEAALDREMRQIMKMRKTNTMASVATPLVMTAQIMTAPASAAPRRPALQSRRIRTFFGIGQRTYKIHL